MERFWVYLDNKVQGPVEIPALRKLSGFNLLTQVCQEGQEAWRMADEVIEIKAYFSAPPRGSSLLPDAQPEIPYAASPQVEMPALRRSEPDVETLEELPVAVTGNTVAQPAPASGGLRIPCVTCGYKNPRDVTLCMKCGAPVKAAEEKPPIALSALSDTAIPESVAAPKIEPFPAVLKTPVAAGPKADSSMVEIPVTRILMILAGTVLVGAIFFTVRHMWKASHKKKAPLHPVVVSNVKPAAAPAARQGTKVPRSVAAALPGVQPTPARAQPSKPAAAPEPEAAAPEKAKAPPASYSVISEAYPLKQRQPAPVDSKFAVKRRGDRGLWSEKEAAAIQLAQNRRIYGGQRTVRRNAEILMQILRDREYIAAYESGKRPFYFDDADWAASQKEGPMFEVRLTFSGGKEADGSPRQPLRFAFNVDLERQSVEPGGSSFIKANTMHAFFDESRIPPEERRSVARDTEELVKAAQPNASPLALETITKNYATTYSYAVLTRVANAFGLTLVNKKLERETASVKDILPDAKPLPVPQPKAASKERVKTIPSASGAIQYTMERGKGKDRLLTVTAPSSATPARIWETLTSYDRLTQFVPDLLISQREGQDGQAVIVHTVSLTRLMFFVFKINLHLRILEHPQQHRLEFERIAGDFEKFSGYAEIKADPTGTRSEIKLHVTLAPTGYVPEWAFRGMAEHFVVPVVDAVRSKAETN